MILHFETKPVSNTLSSNSVSKIFQMPCLYLGYVINKSG